MMKINNLKTKINNLKTKTKMEIMLKYKSQIHLKKKWKIKNVDVIKIELVYPLIFRFIRK